MFYWLKDKQKFEERLIGGSHMVCECKVTFTLVDRVWGCCMLLARFLLTLLADFAGIWQRAGLLRKAGPRAAS